MKKSLVIFLGMLACITALSVPASAEWFADLFVGPSFTQSEDVVYKTTTIGSIRDKDVNFKNVVSFGGRAGYWFESTPYIGLAMDVSHFRPDIGRQSPTRCLLGFCFEADLFPVDLAVTGISFDVLLRLPLLTSKEFPKGQLQPYLTVGPTIFISSIDINESGFTPSKHSDTDTSVGVKAGAGLAWQFHRNVALFTEYRFTHFAPEFTMQEVNLGKTRIKTDLNTHRVIFGISFRLPTP